MNAIRRFPSYLLPVFLVLAATPVFADDARSGFFTQAAVCASTTPGAEFAGLGSPTFEIYLDTSLPEASRARHGAIGLSGSVKIGIGLTNVKSLLLADIERRADTLVLSVTLGGPGPEPLISFKISDLVKPASKKPGSGFSATLHEGGSENVTLLCEPALRRTSDTDPAPNIADTGALKTVESTAVPPSKDAGSKTVTVAR